MANFAVNDLDISEEQKTDFLDNLKLLNYLIVYESVFLGKKASKNTHQVDIFESLEVVTILLEKELKDKLMGFPKDGFLVNCDRVMVKEYLFELLSGISQKSTFIKINSDSSERLLVFEFDSDYKPPEISGELIDLIESRSTNKILMYQLALRVLGQCGLRTEFSKGKIKLFF